MNLVSLDAGRLANFIEYFACNKAWRLKVCELLQHHHEFITRKPHQKITFAQRAFQSLCDFAQQLIADTVTERVVHFLKAIQIDEQCCHPHATAPRARDRLLHAILQHRPVRQTGEAVVRCLIDETLLGQYAGGNILRKGKYRHNLAGLIAQAGVVPFTPDDATVVAVVAIQTGGAWMIRVKEAHVDRTELRVIVLNHKAPITKVFAQHLTLGPAENFLGLRRPASNVKLVIPLDHRKW